jgi:N-acetylglucosamine-6-phosphate deacetylase
MTDRHYTAYAGARIFDGAQWHDGAALVVDGDTVAEIGAAPAGAEIVNVAGGFIAPGFVDLQVNGGGGHLIGAGTTADDIALVCSTHADFGATAILPTLITDTEAVTDAVLSAGAEAARRQVPGFLGLHLEGPHLSVARKGAHDPAHIRPMTDADLVRYENARRVLPHLLVTVAAETVAPEQIARLVAAGIVVSIGHSDASYEVATAAFRAGASMATHLFNAMSQIGNRTPGVVGAALDHPKVASGVIADGIHVHPAGVRIALAATGGKGRLFLVSDSMSQAGTAIESFTLNGRTIYRRDGALRLADGTLAGADLTIDQAVRSAMAMGIDAGTALAMASAYPARALGAPSVGRLVPGSRADAVLLDDELRVLGTIRGGRVSARATS